MKITTVKYMLMALSVSTLCTDAQALSKKSKAIIKSSALGTASGVISLGAAALALNHLNRTNQMAGLAERSGNVNDRFTYYTIAGNSLTGALCMGYAAIKAAQKSVSYFKNIKQELNKQEVNITE